MIRCSFIHSFISPSLGQEAIKVKFSPTFWLLKRHNENTVIFNANHTPPLVSEKIKVFMAATQSKLLWLLDIQPMFLAKKTL